MINRIYATLGMLGIMTASLSSGQAVRSGGAIRSASSTAKPAIVNAQALIKGTALDVHSMPLPNATVRLRNLSENRVEQVSTANELGEFIFIARPDIPYVVEITDQAGRTIAVGDIITAQSGEVAAAMISVPTRVSPLAAFADTASSVASALAGTGITALDPGPKLSPEQ